MKTGVFLERDGLLNAYDPKMGLKGAPVRVEHFKVNDSVRPFLDLLKSAGLILIVTTNQPAISRGLMSRNELDMMHAILRRKLPVDEILMCPHDDPTHPCCKPQPGMFMEGAFKWGLDLDRSFVVSDKWQDAKAAQIVGCTSVLIDSPHIGNDHHDFVVPDFATAAKKILQLHSQQFSVAASA